ncbi:hypothetical protein CZ771_10090 [Actinomycetales bacterium JB111]|nr:hypothetical protein CZ771_10090 [Actinomycetales bacterium JB111]
MTAVYPPGDPRAQLTQPAVSTANRAVGDDVLPFQHTELGATQPDDVTPGGSASWIHRGQNVVVVTTDLAAGDVVERTDVDEVMLVVASSGPVLVEAGAESAELTATSIAMIPPGTSRLTASGGARIVRLFAPTARDLATAAANAELYDPAPGSIAVHEPWPAPAGGHRLLVYPDLESIEPSPDRMGRIFRNRHAMVNVLYPRTGPRDPRTLSPHDHDDFEQISLAYEGEYVHHIRAHWGKDRTQWREDEHVASTAPSIAVIPPPLIHTSEAVGAGANKMLDIFAGPRADFSAREGWVLNAADYPAPGEAVG